VGLAGERGKLITVSNAVTHPRYHPVVATGEEHYQSSLGVPLNHYHHVLGVMVAMIDGQDTETVINALIKQARKLPRELYESLTWDRGRELADHKRFTLATDIKVYFCDPQSPWQRGSNENTNALLRQHFPKGTDLSAHSQAKLNALARQLNGRLRKTLDYETQTERFSQCCCVDRLKPQLKRDISRSGCRGV